MKKIIFCTLLSLATSVSAQTLATRNKVSVTVEDFYAYHYMNSPKKVEALRGSPKEIESTITEVLAPRTYNTLPDAKTKLDPIESRYVKLQQERAPLLAELNVIERRVRAQFDPNNASTLARARELWALDTDRFLTDEFADITQIYFDLALRPFADVAKRIDEAQTALASGQNFETVLQKYTDDKLAKDTKGRLLKITSAGSDPLMGNLIFRKLKEGEVSAPTATRIGLHIVRLDKKYPKTKKSFDEVKGQIFEQMMEEGVKNARLSFLEKLAPEQTAINAENFEDFLIKPDPKLEEKRREIYRNLGISTSSPVPGQ